jgi:hypothetical protein
MLNFLAANLGNIIVSAILILMVALVIVSLVRKKKKGQTTCGCGCEKCPSAGICHK